VKFSLRSLLCCLAFAAALPALCLAARGMFSDRDAAVAEARAGLAALLRRGADPHGPFEKKAHALLLSLADNESIRIGRRTEVTDLFAEILKNNPQYENIFLTDADGLVRISARPPVRTDVAGTDYFAALARGLPFYAGAASSDTVSGRAAFSTAVPLIDRESGGMTACLAAEVKIAADEREALSRIQGAYLFLRDASGRVSCLYPPDRERSGAADIRAADAAGRDRVVFERALVSGDLPSSFPVLRLSVPAGAVYGAGDGIVRLRLPFLIAAALCGLLVAFFGGGIAVAPLQETASAARALAGGGVMPPARRAPSGETAALRAALDKTAVRLHELKKKTTEAGTAGEEADKTWNEVLFCLGRDMREPVNTILDMAHLAAQSECAPPLRALLDRIDAAAESLGTLSDELAALPEPTRDKPVGTDAAPVAFQA
jgi:hypothetical protein